MANVIDIASRLGQRTAYVWRGAAGLALLVLALFSFKEIEPGEAACRINDITGAQESITQPGWVTRVPFIHSIHIMPAAPQTFSMAGENTRDDLHVRALTVRASDGSNFHFDDTSIIFKLQGDQACSAVRDSGPETGFLGWMRHYSRAILRDEFGRESTIAVSNPTTYTAATDRAKARLVTELGPHALEIEQLVTPKPRFNPEYEDAIEQRNALGNELEVIESNLARAETSRNRQLAEVDQLKNKEIQEKRASLESELATAIAEQADKKREADTIRITALGQGQAALSGATHRARELAGELDARYTAKKAEIEAFRTQPVERVMERLGEKLKGVTFHIDAWANDSVPTRVVVDK